MRYCYSGVERGALLLRRGEGVQYYYFGVERGAILLLRLVTQRKRELRNWYSGVEGDALLLLMGREGCAIVT